MESQWQGNGSIISKSTGDLTGFGIDKDVSQIHTNSEKPVVFFQWEIDGADGRRLKISGGTEATITYGAWSSRSEDRVFKKVALPFVLDPTVDGKQANDGAYYVVAVQYDSAPQSSIRIDAEATDEPGQESDAIGSGVGLRGVHRVQPAADQWWAALDTTEPTVHAGEHCALRGREGHVCLMELL